MQSRPGELAPGEPQGRRSAVHLVASEPTMRARVTKALAAGSLQLASAVSRVDELALDGEAGPSLVILAMGSSPGRRVSMIRSLKERPGVHVMVCQKSGMAEVRRSVIAGADGYVLEQTLDKTLVPAIQAVLAGLVALPREDRHQVGPPTLSTREKQVMALVVLGYMNYEIATQLHLAESTVKSHLSSVFTKLGVRSRNEAVELILDAEQGLGRGILAITSDLPPERAAHS